MIRLADPDGESWDVLVDRTGARLTGPGKGQADAVLSADERDLGPAGPRRGERHARLPRGPAAGAAQPAPRRRASSRPPSPDTGPGRFRFARVRTKAGEFSTIEAGTGRAGDHAARAGRHEGVVPAERRGARGLVPDHRGRHARLRRLEQAAGRVLRPRLPGRCGRAAAGRAGARARPLRRPQLRRPRRARARLPPSRTHGRPRADDARRWPGCASAGGRRTCDWCGRSWASSRSRRGRWSTRSCKWALPAPTRRGPRRRSTSSSASSRARAAARRSTPRCASIYLDEPHGDKGFWTQLETLAPESLFIWGRHDRLVSTGFMKHVERALPAARHVELDCGHIPQIERPAPDARRDRGVPAHAACLILSSFLRDRGPPGPPARVG